MSSEVQDYGGVMPMGGRPPASGGKRCATMGRSRARVGQFDRCSDSPGGRMTGWSSSQGCFLFNLQ